MALSNNDTYDIYPIIMKNMEAIIEHLRDTLILSQSNIELTNTPINILDIIELSHALVRNTVDVKSLFLNLSIEKQKDILQQRQSLETIEDLEVLELAKAFERFHTSAKCMSDLKTQVKDQQHNIDIEKDNIAKCQERCERQQENGKILPALTYVTGAAGTLGAIALATGPVGWTLAGALGLGLTVSQTIGIKRVTEEALEDARHQKEQVEKSLRDEEINLERSESQLSSEEDKNTCFGEEVEEYNCSLLDVYNRESETLEEGKWQASILSKLKHDVVLLEEQASIWKAMEEELLHHLVTNNSSQIICSIFQNCERLMSCLLKIPHHESIVWSIAIETLQTEMLEISNFLPALTNMSQLNAVDFS